MPKNGGLSRTSCALENDWVCDRFIALFAISRLSLVYIEMIGDTYNRPLEYVCDFRYKIGMGCQELQSVPR